MQNDFTKPHSTTSANIFIHCLGASFLLNKPAVIVEKVLCKFSL